MPHQVRHDDKLKVRATPQVIPANKVNAQQERAAWAGQVSHPPRSENLLYLRNTNRHSRVQNP